uniref:Uncharacterized protein n=1 Tax=Octopus bimaculoides TaxID=37653 RepID=A0A0L8HYR3_OCTBM
MEPFYTTQVFTQMTKCDANSVVSVSVVVLSYNFVVVFTCIKTILLCACCEITRTTCIYSLYMYKYIHA